MGLHVASLSTQLEQYSREGTSERQILEKQAKLLEELMEAQQNVSNVKRKHQAVVRKLSLSEKSNSLLASRLSYKSDQLQHFLESAEENSDFLKTHSATSIVEDPLVKEAAKQQEKQLLDYLRLFSKEWGHPTYNELQRVVGYQSGGAKGDDGGIGDGSRQKSLF